MTSAGSGSMTPDVGFPRREHIKRGKEIQTLLRSGRKASVRGMALFWAPGEPGRNRVAVALRRGYGNAVARNRAKRCIREGWRLSKPLVRSGFDLVFLAFPDPDPKSGPDTFNRRSRQISRLLAQANLLAAPAPSPKDTTGMA